MIREEIPPSDWLELIPYSRIFAHTPTEQFAEQLAAQLPRRQAIQLLAELAALEYDRKAEGVRSTAGQHERLRRIGRGRDEDLCARIEEYIDRGGVFVHAHQLALLIKLMLLHGREDSAHAELDVDLLLRAMLVVNELFGRHQGLVGADTPVQDLVDVELRGAIIPQVDLASMIPRQYEFLQWSRAAGRSCDNWIDVEADFLRLFRLTLQDHLVICALFSTYMINASGALSPIVNPVVSIAALERSMNDPSVLRRWIERFVTPVERILADLQGSARDFSAGGLLPFLRHPLVALDGDTVICPLPACLDNLFGAGFYFRLFDEYGSVGETDSAKRFSAFYGRFFEDYVATLLERVLAPAAGKVERDRRYLRNGTEVRSFDFAALDEAGRLVVIEAAKTRLNLVATLVRGNRTALQRDIEQLVVANARQIARVLSDFRAGLFDLGFKFSDVRAIYPVIVCGQRIPGLYGVNALVEERLRRGGELSDCEPLHVMCLDELEMLASAYPRGLELGAILEQKHRHPKRYARSCTLHNFIDRYASTTTAGRDVPTSFDEFFDQIMMPTLRSWGLT